MSLFYVNICGALITAKNTIILAVKKNTEFSMIFFTQIFPKICVVLKVPQKNTIKFAVEKNFELFFAFLTQIFAEIFLLL